MSRTPSRSWTRTAEKAAFVLSVAAFAFLAGVAVQAFEWPPSAFLERAWHQFRRVAGLLTVEERYPFLETRVYARTGARTLEPDRVQPGLTLVASHWKDRDWKSGLRLIDADGTLVHEWRPEAFEVFPDSVDARPQAHHGVRFTPIHGFHLEPNGEVVANVEHLGTVRLDACGNPIWKVARGNNHSVVKADDGSFWIPGAVPSDSVGYGKRYPGLPDTVRGELILHVSGDGRVLSEIDVLDLLYANGLQRHFVNGVVGHDFDFMHINDVEPLSAALADGYPMFESGDLMVSLRNLDLVFVFDPESGVVKWDSGDLLVRQHDPDWLGDGWIGVFDNRWDDTPRGALLGGSRVVAIRPEDGETEDLYPRSGSEPLYTAFMGHWQRLENGNILLTESLTGRLAEVAPDGRTVWEWIIEPYDEEWTPWITGALRYPIGPEDVAAWTCRPADSEAPGTGP